MIQNRIQALSKDGTHSVTNFRPTAKYCNPATATAMMQTLSYPTSLPNHWKHPFQPSAAVVIGTGGWVIYLSTVKMGSCGQLDSECKMLQKIWSHQPTNRWQMTGCSCKLKNCGGEFVMYSSWAIHPREASDDQKIHGSELFRTSVRWPPTLKPFQVRKSHRFHFGSRMSDILFRWMLATRTCWNDKMVSTSYVDISISIYCIPLSTSPSEGLYHYSSPPKSDKKKLGYRLIISHT